MTKSNQTPNQNTDSPPQHSNEERAWFPRWLENEHIPRWIGATASSLTAISVIIGFGTYVLDRHVRSASLIISSPEVIEFRCSAASFRPKDCWGADDKAYTYLSVTGAFRMTANGPAAQEVAITGGTAVVTLESDPGTGSAPGRKTDVYRLRAFWSGDLTGSADPGLKQIVPTSLRGGQSISQEIWFFPLSELCGARSSATACEERQNFRPWYKFVGDLDNSINAGIETAKIEFHFTSSNGDGVVNEQAPITCTVSLGSSLHRMIERGNLSPDTEDQTIYLTLPCNEFQKLWSTL